MKKLAATASALALLGTGAYAQSVEDTAQVTLTASVGEYIAITQALDSAITVVDPAGDSGVPGNNNRNGSFTDKSLIEVTANVDFDLTLEWATWDNEGPGQPSDWPSATTFSQAYYVNGAEGCAIGGTITFDVDPATNSNNTSTPPSGASPWTVNDTFAASYFTPGANKQYGIGIEASPNLTDCTGGVAAPGDYSLDVDITVAAAS
ncbi:hypothetical protein [Rhodosalinus sp. 5P4]|uniref:hypothetical protein n=1 Tax=Rhodosalinus sp. 5P4 TaxID=3239196 RepID=UPI00352650A4